MSELQIAATQVPNQEHTKEPESAAQLLAKDTVLDDQLLARDRVSDTASETAVLRVAVYILLSQETSYEANITHFNKIIHATPNYTSAGIYSDYTSILSASRTNYDRLLKDCREGRIDRILCRSVSDFARDEAGFLEVLNFLESCHVTVLFEEENLDTSDPSAVLTLSGLATFHREEKRNVSASFHEIRRRQRAGGVTANRAIYGYRYAEGEDAYDTTEDGYARRRVVIVEEEADVVRRIFRLVADGKSYSEVARILNEEGVPAPGRKMSGAEAGRVSVGAEAGSVVGDAKSETESSVVKTGTGSVGWTAQRISQMVRLERYMGDALLQKSYIIPGESGKRVMNRGELPQEYVEGNHPAIVSRELFEAAQRPRRKEYKAGSNADDGRKFETTQRLQAKSSVETTIDNSRGTEGAAKEEDILPQKKASVRRRLISPPALSGKIICGECGRYYHITNRKTSAIWVCPSARLHNGIDICSAESVREEKLWEILQTALMVRFGTGGNGTGSGDGVRIENEPCGGDGGESGSITESRRINESHSRTERKSERGDGGSSSFVDVREIIKNLITLLERYRDFEYLERADFERSLEDVRSQKKRMEGTIRMTQARLDAQNIRMEILGEADPEEETISVLSKQLEGMKEESGQLALKENKISQQMEARKPYWAELAKGAAAREKTLSLLRELMQEENLREEMNGESQMGYLPEEMNGESQVGYLPDKMNDESQTGNLQKRINGAGRPENLWNVMSDEFLASLVISITIYKNHVTVRWLDDTVTELKKD